MQMVGQMVQQMVGRWWADGEVDGDTVMSIASLANSFIFIIRHAPVHKCQET